LLLLLGRLCCRCCRLCKQAVLLLLLVVLLLLLLLVVAAVWGGRAPAVGPVVALARATAAAARHGTAVAAEKITAKHSRVAANS
jgi:hypothetical protein